MSFTCRFAISRLRRLITALYYGAISFDVAKGLCLLPVQHKRSRDPGDSAENDARRREAFLDAGHYQPLRMR